jgi:hypothetical protein
MPDFLDQYASIKPAARTPWGKVGVNEERLNDLFERLLDERLTLLTQAGMLASTKHRVDDLVGYFRVYLSGAPKQFMNATVDHALFQNHYKPYAREPSRSFSGLVLQAQVALLGEKEFLERHWKSFAVKLRQADAELRAELGLPKPEGLASWDLQRELSAQTPIPSESAAAKRPRAL